MRTSNRIFRHRVVRLLTLFSFFQFSGLNNGFTTLVMTSGKMERVDLAPALVASCAAFLSPIRIGRLVLPFGAGSFLRSRRAVECASQRVVENMLAESSLFQMWFKEACLKALYRGDKGIRPGSGMAQTAEGRSAAVPISGSRFDRRAGAAQAWDDWREWMFEGSTGYLTGDRREFWVQDRLHFWGAGREGGGGVLRSSRLKGGEAAALPAREVRAREEARLSARARSKLWILYVCNRVYDPAGLEMPTVKETEVTLG